MATTLTQQTSRTKVVVTAYVILTWFALVLAGSILGIFVPQQGNPPLALVLTVGGPVTLFVAGYLLSDTFRGVIRSLIGDPWGIIALQAYRVLGFVFVVQVLRNALPAMFGLSAGLGDIFIGITAPLVALAWSSGTRSGKVVFVLWNILGMLDLVIAVSLGLLTASIPPTTASLLIFPLSLIPTFAVPLSFILHFTGLAQFSYLSSKKESNPSYQASMA